MSTHPTLDTILTLLGFVPLAILGYMTIVMIRDGRQAKKELETALAELKEEKERSRIESEKAGR